MIGFIRGILAEKGNGYIVVDVNGVGYLIFVPANSGAYLKGEGEEVMVYTAMMVREDDISLYGFTGRNELDIFRKLISVSGIGAKAAVSILSSFTVEQVQQAIVFEDAKTLTKASGIGKKTAERIVLELRDKFSGKDIGSDIESGAQDKYISEHIADSRSEAISALIALGYTRGEASGALAAVKDNDMTAEEYIKAALKNLF